MEQILNEIKRNRFQANTNTDKADIIFKYHSTKKQLNDAKSEVTKWRTSHIMLQEQLSRNNRLINYLMKRMQNRNRLPLDYSALSAEIALNAEDT